MSSSSGLWSLDISDEKWIRLWNGTKMLNIDQPTEEKVDNCNDTDATNSSSADIADIEIEPTEVGLYTDFESMGLRRQLLNEIYAYGLNVPSILQQKAIMPIINGVDMLIQANSGSGKTATFTIALLQSLNTYLTETQALVLTPSGATATEVQQAVLCLGGSLKATSYACVDGRSSEEDIRQLQYGQHIVSGTPDIILDMIKKGALRTKRIKTLIMDEADVMVSNKFKKQIYEIYSYLPPAKQTIIITAMLSYEVFTMDRELTSKSIKIVVKPDEPTVDMLDEDEDDDEDDGEDDVEEPVEYRFNHLLRYILPREQIVVFCATKEKVLSLAKLLLDSYYSVSSIHSDMSQEERNKVMKEFRWGRSRVLISSFDCASDVKVEQHPVVVNHEVPTNHEHYLLRYGRPACFGPKGMSIRFVDEGSILPADGEDEEMFEFDDL